MDRIVLDPMQGAFTGDFLADGRKILFPVPVHVSLKTPARFSNSSLIFLKETWPQNRVKCLFESYIFQTFAQSSLIFLFDFS